MKMKPLVVAFLILGVVVLLEANPIDTGSGEIGTRASALDERGLLDGVLGGLLGGGESQGGGLLGGVLGGVPGGGIVDSLLGPSGLVGGVLGPSGLVGGLLGGGEGQGGGLLGGLLGGGGGSGGGLLNGVLGTTGLLGGVLGGDLLGGLLGGGKLGGGLLGGLLGGANGTGLLGGPLNGILGPKGLVGSLLGGRGNSSLLGGLLGGNGGLLGGLVGEDGLIGLVNKLLCLLTRLGLQIVMELISNLKIDKVLGMNMFCKDPRGGDLLSTIFKDGANVPLAEKVVCLTNAIGTEPTVELLQKLNVNNTLPFLNANCSGAPLLKPNSTASGILTKLLGSLDASMLSQSRLNAVVELAKQLDSAKLPDVTTVIAQLLCLLKQLRLDVVVSLVKDMGLDVVLNITNTHCKVGQPLFGDLTRATGLTLQEVISSLGCLINRFGLAYVETRIAQNQLSLLVKLNSMCSAPGGGALIESLLKGGLSMEILIKIGCILSGLKIESDVLDLVTRLGAEKLIKLQEIACPAGSPLFNLTSPTGRLVIELVLRFGTGAAASLNALDIPRLDKIISSVTGVDFKTIIDKLYCSITHLGFVAAIYTLGSLGVSGAFGLSTSLCDAGNGLSSDNALKILVENTGLETLLGLITQLGVDFVVTLANFLVVNGKFLGAELLKEILCVLQAIGVQALVDIFKQTDPANFRGVYNYFCPKGQPLTLSANAEFFGKAVIDCWPDATQECADSLETAVSVSCGLDCPGTCQSLPLKASPKSICLSYCSSICQGGK